ncbi:MAG TPA: tetratricopeptide repeat protein [Thermoclostridium sp.]|nr:tetratricopeptide repeat protein [Thermoclostridium sp.]
MNVPLIFIALIVCLFTIYMMNRFVRRPGIFTILILIIQFLSATIVVFSLFENVFTTPQIELAIIVCGIIIPFNIVLFDYIKMKRKIKGNGINAHLIEKKKKQEKQKLNISYFLENADAYKEEISALTVFESLDINDKKISNSIKRQLILLKKLIGNKRYEIAALKYRFLFGILPQSAEIAYNTGYLYCIIGKYHQAHKILNKALRLAKKEKNYNNKQSSDHGQELLNMILFYNGYALYYMGRYDQSISCFQKVLSNNPELAAANKNIARAYLAMDMTDRAIEYLERGSLDDKDDLVRIILGSMYYKKGDTTKTIKVLGEVDVADIKQIDAIKYKGKAALKENAFELAEQCFRKLIELEPTEPLNYYHLALSQREMKNKEEALKTYQKGLYYIPNNSMLVYNAGTLLDELGDKEQAVQYLYQSIETEETVLEAYNHLGVLLGQLNRFRESVQVFDNALKIFGGSYQLYYNRGIVLEMSRRYEDAVISFENAYEIKKTDQVLIYHYTAVLLKTRQYTKALKIYKNSLINYPEDAQIYFGLSKIYAYMGEKDIAVELLQRVLECDPTYLTEIKKEPEFKILYRHKGFQSLMVS